MSTDPGRDAPEGDSSAVPTADNPPPAGSGGGRPSAGRFAIAAYALLGLACTVLVVVDSSASGSESTSAARTWLVAGVLGLAIALSRLTPASALALLAISGAGQLVLGIEVPSDIAAVAVVTFNCGRRGRASTIWAACAYLASAYALGGLYAVNTGTHVTDAISSQGTSAVDALLLALLGTAGPLAVPVMLGLTLRMRARAQENRERQLRAEADRHVAQAFQAKAEEIARVESERSALARDVHDVVGHSLAVILAQAESGLILEAGEPSVVRQVLRTIANSARASLEDVRAVLQPDRTVAATSLDALVAGVPPTIEVTDLVLGTPRELAPEISVVASRTLQEMLTNALKHSCEARMEVTRDWSDGLRIRVSNSAEDTVRGSGLGLVGMRRRVEDLGGTVTVDDLGTRFTVEAYVPRIAPE